MAGRKRLGPAEPLSTVEPQVAIINALLGLSMSRDLAPKVATAARALYQGMSGQKAGMAPGDSRLIFEPIYVLGRVLGDYLTGIEDEEEDECPSPTSSSAPEKQPAVRASRAGNSTTGAVPSGSRRLSRPRARAVAPATG